MQELDVRDSNQVASVSFLDADLGVGGRRLLVLSGIALTDWKYDSDAVWRGETQVRLGVFASNLEQWSAFVGLASIANDESAFVFSADTASVRLDPSTGELLLHINTALMGEWSYLGRLSYQVVVTVVRVSPHIAGTITWHRSLFTPSSLDPSLVAGGLIVMASHVEFSGTPGDQRWGTLSRTPIAPGQVTKLEEQKDYFVAYYRVENPRMAISLQVSIDVGGPFPPGTVAGQVSGPTEFTLTGAAPSIDGVNFNIVSADIVR